MQYRGKLNNYSIFDVLNNFNRSELQLHRKNYHPNTILFCSSKVMNGIQCPFGKHCLFKHNENETSERHAGDEVCQA